jgi:hypothetical protein
MTTAPVTAPVPVTSAEVAVTDRRRQVARFLVAAGVRQELADKALMLLADGGLIASETPGTWYSTASDGTTVYFTSPFFCTCPATLQCYHRLAAIIEVAASAFPQP